MKATEKTFSVSPFDFQFLSSVQRKFLYFTTIGDQKASLIKGDQKFSDSNRSTTAVEFSPNILQAQRVTIFSQDKIKFAAQKKIGHLV